jgi:cytoskeleton protein RodZ
VIEHVLDSGQNAPAAAMFEIGISLREAREKRGLELDAVQKALRIRRRYLEALESDRFEQLPGEVYTRGFLREYAEFLGLDGSLYVEEYNARHASHEPQAIAAQPTAPRLPRRSGRAGLVLVVVAAVAVAVGLAAWRLGGHGSSGSTSQPPSTTTVPAPSTTTAPAAAPAPVAEPQQQGPAQQLILTATRGDCWVGIRVGSPNGRTLYWRTLKQGTTIRFSLKRPLWLRVGHGGNLDVTVGGKPVQDVPAVTGNITIS